MASDRTRVVLAASRTVAWRNRAAGNGRSPRLSMDGIDMSEGGDILVTASANLWRGAEAVGGRLTLSRAGLQFRAHAYNRQPEPLEIPVDEIVEVRKTRTMGILPNGLAVTTKLGLEIRFVVGDRDRFVEEITKLTALS